jgi:hypothetical protein
MPGSNHSDRQGNKIARQRALLNRAKVTNGDVQNWTQYFTQKFTGSTTYVTTSTVGTHVGLYAFAKVALAVGGLVIPAAGVGGLIAGTMYGMKDILLEYGAAAIEDLIKEGATQSITGTVGYLHTGGETVVTTDTVKRKSSIEKTAKELCESMGALAALIQQSQRLQAATCKYCDDVYAKARVVERAQAEMITVKNKINELKTKLEALKGVVDGALTTDLNARKESVKTEVLAMVAKDATWHFQNNWGSFISLNTVNPAYRFVHCSEAQCYGPGPSGTD